MLPFDLFDEDSGGSYSDTGAREASVPRRLKTAETAPSATPATIAAQYNRDSGSGKIPRALSQIQNNDLALSPGPDSRTSTASAS